MDLSTVEMYDPRERSWRTGPSLRQGRRGFGLVSIDVSYNDLDLYVGFVLLSFDFGKFIYFVRELTELFSLRPFILLSIKLIANVSE